MAKEGSSLLCNNTFSFVMLILFLYVFLLCHIDLCMLNFKASLIFLFHRPSFVESFELLLKNSINLNLEKLHR